MLSEASSEDGDAVAVVLSSSSDARVDWYISDASCSTFSNVPSTADDSLSDVADDDAVADEMVSLEELDVNGHTMADQEFVRWSEVEKKKGGKSQTGKHVVQIKFGVVLSYRAILWVLVWLLDLEEKLLQDLLGVLGAGDSMASDTGVDVDLVVVTAL